VVITEMDKVKNSLTNFRKDWNKFPEIFCGKFLEISKLTTLTMGIYRNLVTVTMGNPLGFL